MVYDRSLQQRLTSNLPLLRINGKCFSHFAQSEGTTVSPFFGKTLNLLWLLALSKPSSAIPGLKHHWELIFLFFLNSVP